MVLARSAIESTVLAGPPIESLVPGWSFLSPLSDVSRFFIPVRVLPPLSADSVP